MAESQKDIFAKAAKSSGAGRIWKAMDRKPARPKLNIRTIKCPKGCGGTTTTLASHACAECHFGGWWGEWR